MANHIARVVRPGGLVDLCEYDFRSYDVNGDIMPVDGNTPPWWAKWLTHLRYAVASQGGNVEAAEKLLSYVEANPAYEGVVYKEYLLPVVPPPRTGNETYQDIRIREGQRENCLVSWEWNPRNCGTD